jgi:hypothetical protein
MIMKITQILVLLRVKQIIIVNKKLKDLKQAKLLIKEAQQ